MNNAQRTSDWRDGYATTLDYTAGHYPNLYPEHLNFSCVLHGVEPPTLSRQYAYFELGCGHGSTVSVLAASNPQAQFHANDFMPSHVAGARRLAGAAGLNNLRILEHSFATLADDPPDLPEFDYITLQGVYTWVAPEVRRQIVRFIARHLKPGGVVCLGYNAMPGWAASLPAQRWMQAAGQWFAGDGAGRVTNARAWLQRLADSGAEAFTDNPPMARRLAQIGTGSPAYLQHEYMNGHWEPMYHADVAHELAAAKLDFVGSAMLPAYWMGFPPAQQALLDAIPEPSWRETAKDYLLGSSFRTDVFVKGRRAIDRGRRQALLDGFSVALTVTPDTALKALARTDAGLAGGLRHAVEQLATRPHRFEELRGCAAGGDSGDDTGQVMAAMLSMNRHATLYREADSPVDGRAARAWNACIAAEAQQGGACTALASPVTGGGIDTDVVGLAVYRQLVQRPEADPERIMQQALQDLQEAAGPQPADAHIAPQDVLEHIWPLWRQLATL